MPITEQTPTRQLDSPAHLFKEGVMFPFIAITLQQTPHETRKSKTHHLGHHVEVLFRDPTLEYRLRHLCKGSRLPSNSCLPGTHLPMSLAKGWSGTLNSEDQG